MIKALIIDDEKHCIDNLQWQLKQYCPDVEVICMFSKMPKIRFESNSFAATASYFS